MRTVPSANRSDDEDLAELVRRLARRGGDGVGPRAAAAPGDDPDLRILVYDDEDRPIAVAVRLLEGCFLGRLRQRATGQRSVEVRVATPAGRPLGSVVLLRPPRERGAPILVEIERIGPARVAVRVWAEDDLGYAEETFEL